jgi:thiamine biosynthesis lipoprotein
MGTIATVTLYASTPDEAQQAFVKAFARIAELDSILSDYKPDSELSRFCESRKPPGKDLAAILKFAQEISAETNGAFDIAIGPLTRLWRQARKDNRLPTRKEIDDARNNTGGCVPLDAGGIAKGFAADEALSILRSIGIQSALVAISGDIAIGDPPPGQQGWKVMVAGQTRTMHKRGVSTSGDTYQHQEIDGVRYSHIIDPRTGWALENSHQVAVIADTAMEADAVATAVSVAGRDAVQRPGVEIIID